MTYSTSFQFNEFSPSGTIAFFIVPFVIFLLAIGAVLFVYFKVIKPLIAAGNHADRLIKLNHPTQAKVTSTEDVTPPLYFQNRKQRRFSHPTQPLVLKRLILEETNSIWNTTPKIFKSIPLPEQTIGHLDPNATFTVYTNPNDPNDYWVDINHLVQNKNPSAQRQV